MELYFLFVSVIASAIAGYCCGLLYFARNPPARFKPEPHPAEQLKVLELLREAHEIGEVYTISLPGCKAVDGDHAFFCCATGWHAEQLEEVARRSFGPPRLVEEGSLGE